VANKSFPGFKDQVATLVDNVYATLFHTPFKKYTKGFMGSLQGPAFVTLGHNHPKGFGIGPDLPGFAGLLCWTCCLFGYPCSPPAGHGTAKFKSNFNKGIKPAVGKGIA